MGYASIVFSERLEEIDQYLCLLEVLEEQTRHGVPKIEGTGYSIQAGQLRVLYSSVYLQLYNLIEVTVALCLEMVAEAAQQNWKPSQLNDNILREWIRSTARTHIDLDYEKRLDATFELCSSIFLSQPVSDFSIARGGGGNWDDVAIERISRRIGLNLTISNAVKKGIKIPVKDNMGSLVLVKELRNKLAHGEISFYSCSESVTAGELRLLVDRTGNYLKEVVQQFENYVRKHEFLTPENRPSTSV